VSLFATDQAHGMQTLRTVRDAYDRAGLGE